MGSTGSDFQHRRLLSAVSDDDWLNKPPVVPPVRLVTRWAMGLALLAALTYGSFVLAPWRAGNDLWAWALLWFSQVLLLANTIGLWVTSLHYSPDAPESPEILAVRKELADGTSVVSIDVLVTVCGEPIDVIEATAVAARGMRAMRVPHRTWICDDGPSDEVRDLCARLGIGYLTRPDRRGVKAGNINEALNRTTGDFVALLDADHIPHPDFLLVQLPYVLQEGVAFVQGPQSFRNRTGSFVERGSAEGQQLFYEAICPGKNHFNAAFHVGTTAIFRRSALEDVGGFYEDTHSEDIWTSLRMHQRGWRSIYQPHVLARGLGTATVSAYLRQQFRWASGAFEVLLRDNPLSDTRLTPGQRLQYVAPSAHFAMGAANTWFMLLPPLFLLFGIRPLDADSATWIAWYAPLFILTQLILWLQTGWRLRPIVLSIAVAPVHIRAFFAVLLRRKPTWEPSNRPGELPGPLQMLMPQVALLALNVTGIVVGLVVVLNPVTTTISVALCSIYSLILGRVIVQALLERRRSLTSPRNSSTATPLPPPAPAPA